MSEGVPARTARPLRITIGGVVSAMLLAAAGQALVTAAEEPLRPAAISVINFLIAQGRFGILRLPAADPVWTTAAYNLVAGAICLCAGLAIAGWIFPRSASQ